MRFADVETPWVKFGKARDFAFVGRDAVVAVSGLYARFYDWNTGETRIERFEGRDRGDGASRVAGLSSAPIFSLVERRCNPRIAVFAYPSMRRIARCDDSRKANGYACCAFAGTEYLLGQTVFPDFRTILWHWRTGELLATTDPVAATMDPAGDLRATFACSSDSPLLVARTFSATPTAPPTIHRVLCCSKVVRLFPIETSGVSDRKPISLCWTSEGTLLSCDRLGNVEAFEIDEDEARPVGTVARSSVRPSRNPVLVAHRDGAMLVVASPVGDSNDRDVRATFFRRPTTATARSDEHWRPVWTIPLPSYPSRAESHPSDDRIVLFGERGETWAIAGGSRDRAPRLEALPIADDVGEATAIAPLSDPYLAVLSSRPECRLLVVDATTGTVLSPRNSYPSLNHHGEVTRLASHSSLPRLATCSAAGNCLMVDVSTPSAPKIARCVHLQKEPLDRLKFSEDGTLLGVGSSGSGRVFLLEAGTVTDREVAAAFDVGCRMVDFLIYRSDSRDEAKVLVLATASERRPAAGAAIAVFSCRLDGDFRATARADRAITVPFPYESLHGDGSCPVGERVLAIPCLSDRLHRIEFQAEFRQATLVNVVPSLHRTRNLEIDLHRGRTHDRAILLACAYDGTIVAREDANALRVLAVFAAHHGSEGGARSAVLVADAIVSLGRNGDLAANRIPEESGKRVLDVVDSVRSPRPTTILDDFVDVEEIARESENENENENENESENESGDGEPTAQEEDRSSETWMERSLRKRIVADERRARSTRLAILEDSNDLKRRVKSLLDANETEPPAARLPVRAFDLDSEAREREAAAAESIEKRLSELVEERIDRYDRIGRCLRRRFLEPLLVPPSRVSSVLGKSRVTNYPLTETSSRDADLLAWCRFSEAIGRTVSRLEAERDAEPSNRTNSAKRDPANPFDSRHGYLQVRQASVLAIDAERVAKIRFNRLYEEIRSTKRREAKAAIDRAEETRRCVLELTRTFGVDASDRLPNASLWYEAAETSCLDGDRTESSIEQATSDDRDDRDDRDDNDGGETNAERGKRGTLADAKDYEFRRSVLQRTMDGVLRVGPKEKAERIVPLPDCLANEIDPSDYTREDAEAIEAYETKMRAWRADRLAYRSSLEENAERAKEEFLSRARAFDDRLNELATEKIRVERAVLLERLTASSTILWHRRIGRHRREIRRAVEREISPAAKRTRRLAAESELFEAGLIELRNRYEASRRRDKLLEEKYRTDFLDSKQPIAAEQLLRIYRKRPRTSSLIVACGTSLAFLRELAELVSDSATTESELLPRDWLDYPRCLRDLDAIPDGGLPSRVEPDQWREACALRRLKIEAEIKVKICAIELAEAEQSLAFHRRACSNARAALARAKDDALRLEKAMLELLDDREVPTVLKTGQLREQPLGRSVSEWAEAALIPRRELDVVAEALAAAGRRKLTESRRLVDLRRARSLEEWRLERLRRTTEDSRACLLELTNLKARKLDGRDFARRTATDTAEADLCEFAAKTVDPREFSSSRLSFRKLEETVRAERERSRRISAEARHWRRRNSKLTDRIRGIEAETNRSRPSAATRDPDVRVETAGFCEKKIRRNFEEPTTLESRLEISEPKTRPTPRPNA